MGLRPSILYEIYVVCRMWPEVGLRSIANSYFSVLVELGQNQDGFQGYALNHETAFVSSVRILLGLQALAFQPKMVRIGGQYE